MLRASKGALFAALVGLLLTLSPLVAHAAHPQVEAARRSYRNADFQGALQALADAEERDDLERSDLLELLELRALIHLANGNEAGVDEALSLLAIVDPQHQFSPEAPPDLSARFERLREAGPGPIRVSAVATPISGGLLLEARIQGDVRNLTRTTRVYGRMPGGAWADAAGAPLTLRVAPDAEVAYYIEAVGPGGAVIASRGSREEPIATTARVLLEGERTATRPPPEHHDDAPNGDPPWLWIGVGAGVVVAATVIVLAIVLSPDSDVTQPGRPVVEW